MASIRILPLVVDAGVGAVDGYLRNKDFAAGRTDVLDQPVPGKSYFNSYGFLLEVAAVGGGIFWSMQRGNPDYTDPLILGGTALLGQRLGQKIAASNLGGTATAVPAPPVAATGFFRAGAVMPARRAPQYVSNRQVPRVLG